jgi:type I restriction enzyme M protein
MAKKKEEKFQNAVLGIESKLFQTADKMRGQMDASEYKHVVLGLIFLKYISHSFETHYQLLKTHGEDVEDKDHYIAETIFWVPKEARWSYLQSQARQPTIGKLIDEAMLALEKENPSLKNVLTKDYGRPILNKQMLGELIDLIGNIELNEDHKDMLGRVYEYFLGSFAGAEGKRGGEFYTPQCVVTLLVEMLEPYQGRIYDPCCGSGGMFVQSKKFLMAHGGKMGNVAIYGQETNHTTWRLAKMNMAIRGIDADIAWNNEGSFHKDAYRDIQMDYILANPPFNDSDWGVERLKEDMRWKYGMPSAGNANFAWLQHMIHHLTPSGKAGVVLANGSMSSQQSGEGVIRQKLIEHDLVDCMVALPGQLFYTTQIPACLWFLSKNRKKPVDRRGTILFIDARKMGIMVERTRRELTPEEIQKIAHTYHQWQGKEGTAAYEDMPGFCKSVKIEEVQRHDFVLTPGRYVGSEDVEEDAEPFQIKFPRLVAELEQLFDESHTLTQKIRENFKRLQTK